MFRRRTKLLPGLERHGGKVINDNFPFGVEYPFNFIPSKISLFLHQNRFGKKLHYITFQWILCSEWVPSEWESKQLIHNTTPVHQLTSCEGKIIRISLPGMFTHTRILFWWPKLHRMTATGQDTDNKKNYVQLHVCNKSIIRTFLNIFSRKQQLEVKNILMMNLFKTNT